MQTFVNRETKVIVHLQERSMKQLERVCGRWSSLLRQTSNERSIIKNCHFSVQDLELPPARLGIVNQPCQKPQPLAALTQPDCVKCFRSVGSIPLFYRLPTATISPDAYFVVSRGDATVMHEIGYLQVPSRYKSHLAANAQGDNIPQIPQSLLASVNLSKKSQKLRRCFQSHLLS